MRAFVAISLPTTFSNWVQAYRGIFASAVPKLRLVPVASCHMTLRFLGELPNEQVDEAAGRLSRSLFTVSESSITLDRFNVFHRDGQPSVLWVGPSFISRTLTDLAARVGISLSGLGSNDRTEYFTPHVTLGRFAPGTQDVEVAAIQERPLEPFLVPVTNVVLYESVIGYGHPVYIERASVRLAPFAE